MDWLSQPGTFLLNGVAGSISGAFFGWLAARSQTRKQLRGQDLSNTVDHLIQEVDRLRSHSLEYWALVGSNPRVQPLEQEITTLNHSIQETVNNYLAQRHPQFKQNHIQHHIRRLRQVTSGGDFGVKDRPPDPDRSAQITEGATKLENALRVARDASH